MCSRGGDEENELMLPEAQGQEGKPCMKCGEPGSVITRSQDSFCRSCFQVYVVHKFRAAIGKSKLIRDGEQVLVALSGGTNSKALLHLIQDGLSKRAHKKLRFTPVLIHVDESSLKDLPGLSESYQSVEQVASMMDSSGYPSYFTTLENSLVLEGVTKCDGKTSNTNANAQENPNQFSDKSNSDERKSEQASCPSDKQRQLYWPTQEHSERCSSEKQNSLRQRLASVLKGLTSLSAQQDFVCHLRYQLLSHIARQMGLGKVLTADCSTRLAVRILSDISQGRGSQLVLNTSFSDARCGDVLFLKPVRDLSYHELSSYNRLYNPDQEGNKTDAYVEQKGSPAGTNYDSVSALSETFVRGLQAGYQSTVSNIVRTSEKLGLSDMNNQSRCWLCQSVLDTLTSGPSALDAIEVSLKLSLGGAKEESPCTSKLNPDPSLCCGKGDGSCHSAPQERLSTDDIAPGLCYGCRLMLRDFKGDVTSLPDVLIQEASTKLNRQKMREEIADFLLDDDS